MGKKGKSAVDFAQGPSLVIQLNNFWNKIIKPDIISSLNKS